MGEITVILLLALIFIGPKKLPEMASGLGRLIREFRKTTHDVKNEIQLDDLIRKPFEELREAVTLHPDELKRRDRLRKDLEELRRSAAAVEAIAAENGISLQAPVGEGGAEAPALTTEAEASAMDAMPATPGPVAIPQENGTPGAGSPAPLFSPPEGAPEGTVARDAAATVGRVGGTSPGLAAAGAGPVTTGSGLAAALAAIPSRVPKPPSGPTRVPPEGRKSASSLPAVAPEPPRSAADAANTTQILSEADLQAALVSPPPPPASAGSTGRTAHPPPPPRTTSPRLPGATPPKKPT